MPQVLWTDTQLDQWWLDAAQDVNDEVNCLYARMYVTITQGVSVVTLDPVIKKVMRVTWRGMKCDEIAWDDLLALSPATAIISPTEEVDTSIGRPQWWARHPTNLYDIRLYPTPNEAFDNTGDPFSPSINEAKCCIAYWHNIDDTQDKFTLPTYINRRTRKAYAAWRAFEREGRGQDSKAAAYYKAKYKFLVERFRMINSGCYVSMRYQLSDDDIRTQDNMRYPKPMLPPNFERVIY